MPETVSTTSSLNNREFTGKNPKEWKLATGIFDIMGSRITNASI